MEDLAKNVFNTLKGETNGSDFQIKDVQCIPAQVQIVKCTINDIAVDISFNQTAGLSALCFKEKVNEIIGKDHLFKRSIILIKAWCYYESRILGAHHGLISTYALEILIFYIINLFHSSLFGPLAVLYRFLDYYSTFDWENYCVSVNGPVALSSFPEVVVISESEGDELLLGQEFLKNCKETFSAPMKAPARCQEFPIKYLNIMDPLKDSNNLGRSVSKGNFHRIRCALSYGAKRLGEILTVSGEAIGTELENFFVNTLDRNGRGQRPDIQVPVSAFGSGISDVSDLSGDYESYFENLQSSQLYNNFTLPLCAQPRSPFPPSQPSPPPPSLPSPPSASSHPSPPSPPSRPSPPSPPSPSQVQNRTSWDTLFHWVRAKRNGFYRSGRDVFVPNLSLPHPSAVTLHVNERGKSRGTGPYIPDMTYSMYKERVRPRNPEFATRGRNPEFANRGRYPEFAAGGRNPEFAARGWNPEFAAGRRNPEFANGGMNPEFVTGGVSPEFVTAGRNPEFAAAGRKPEFATHGWNPEFATGGRNPEFVNGGRNPEFAAGGRKPDFFTTDGRNSEFASSGRNPEFATGGRKQDFFATGGRNPEFATGGRKPDFFTTGSRNPEFATRGRNPDFATSARNSEFTTSGRNPEFETRGFSRKLSQKPDQSEDFAQTENCANGGCPEFSLEEFPLLPASRKPTPSENKQSGQQTAESPQPSGSSFCIGSIEFGIYGHSPTASTIELSESDFVPKQQGLLEAGKETVDVEPYQLKDDKDFPPLSY